MEEEADQIVPNSDQVLIDDSVEENNKRQLDGTEVRDTNANSEDNQYESDRKRSKLDDGATFASECQQSEPAAVNKVKEEPADSIDSNSANQMDEACALLAVKRIRIKEEPDNRTDSANTSQVGETCAPPTEAPSSSRREAVPSATDCDNNENASDSVEMKTENELPTNSNNANANSAAIRPSCRFGIGCYRANPIHRREEAHPGDQDYRRPNYPSPPSGTPNCPFGSACYRRNPQHFAQYSHPPDTDFARNYYNHQRVLRPHQLPPINNLQRAFGDESDEDDVFVDIGFDEFVPSSDEGVESDLEEADS